MTTRKIKQRLRPVRSSSVKLSTFARRLLEAWKRFALPLTDAQIIVAVSGGADSTALLLAMDELIASRRLRGNLSIAHLDHGLRNESKADALWVQRLAEELGYESAVSRVAVGKRAKATGDNLEQTARRARYDFFAKLARQKQAGLVLTAHTMNDQAETILLRLMRGSGADGLAGIEPVRPFDSQSNFQLVRPLLTWARRADTEAYCRQRKVDFLTDPMNEDEQFARVRVRRQLLPLLESFNTKIVEALVRTSELLRDDLEILSSEADALLQAAGAPDNKSETNQPLLSVRVLAEAPVAVRRRALRRWISDGRGDLRRCELVHILGIEKLLSGDRGGRVAELPGGDKVVRKKQYLELVLNKH